MNPIIEKELAKPSAKEMEFDRELRSAKNAPDSWKYKVGKRLVDKYNYGDDPYNIMDPEGI